MAKAQEAEGKEPLKVISNSNALMKDIQNAAKEVLNLKDRRSDINAKIKAVRTGLKAKGVDEKAFDHVMRYFEANLADRDGYESSRKLVHDALMEVQGDLFDKGVHAE